MIVLLYRLSTILDVIWIGKTKLLGEWKYRLAVVNIEEKKPNIFCVYIYGGDDKYSTCATETSLLHYLSTLSCVETDDRKYDTEIWKYIRLAKEASQKLKNKYIGKFL